MYKDLIDARSKEKYYQSFIRKGSSRRWYQHDIDMIVYSEMFRKMQRKSQLFSIYDPISRSRLIHTFEVVRIAKEISEKLGLNVELTEAIALAHDFGNVAYGKKAEAFLQEKTEGMFKHEEVSALMLKVCASRRIPNKYREEARKIIERDKKITHELNIPEFPYRLEIYQYKDDIYYTCISPEVLDGVVKHGTGITAHTLEGQVVNYADNIAYLIQDISDLESTGIFNEEVKKRYSEILVDLEEKDDNKEFPLFEIVGETTSIRTATLIERFVSCNKEAIDGEITSGEHSEIFQTEIPVLGVEPLLQEAIDRCWEFKKEFYENELIKISNKVSEGKLNQIWDIVREDSQFCEKNDAYIEFDKMLLKCPLFASYKEEKGMKDSDWGNWRKAYFIAHLTCDEIDLVIKSFLERDFMYDLLLPKIN